MRHPNDFGPPQPPPPPLPPPPSAFMMLIHITNTITHLVLGSVATCAFVFAIAIDMLPINSHLVHHVYLCVVGYILMMAQAVLAFSSHTGWALSLKFEDKKIIHMVMQIGGALLALVGSFIRITDLNNNFQTAHGILGLVAMILTVISLVGGVANLFMSTTVFTKVVHSCAGSLTILFAFLCLCLGFDTGVYRWAMGDDITVLAITLTVAGLIGVLFSATVSNIQRITNR
ncbi:hypothetical protein MSG28_008709 [Choristoneura fumiferana]|uniref:Uncharacterized protein n=1 Tax=Choristoneura fumiferana TaxID=7141 RepID=A0ACC0J7P1_CHOFU|nr:hypothetical protein MSG28_008709 [Choristoneura fumiferana]